MSSILGSLAVNFTSNTTGLVRGFNKGKKEAKGFTKAMVGVGTAITAAFGVHQVAGFVSGQLEMVDALSKTSRQLGVSTQVLGAYHHNAQLSGISTDKFNNAMKRLQDTIGAAMLGEAGAIRAFQTIGLSAQQIGEAEDPLRLIQERLKQIGNQNVKVAFLRDTFGRDGVSMMNFFEANLSKVADEYERLGLAVTSAEGKRIEDLNDSMFRLGQVFSGLGRRMVIDASPRLVDSVNGLIAIMETLGFLNGRASGGRGAAQTGPRSVGQQVMNPLGRGSLEMLLTPLFEALESRRGYSGVFQGAIDRQRGIIDLNPDPAEL